MSIHNLIAISDLHCGCQLGLCPPGPIHRDEGGTYTPSSMQGVVWSWWNEFWDQWVPTVTKGEDFAVVLNGDAIDGHHHGSTHQISHNLAIQADIATSCLEPIIKLCDGRFYMIRGTEAHTGPSGQEEEALAKRLGAIPNEVGQYSRHEMWVRLGKGLVHLAHHIGTTGSMHYETTAITKELTEVFTESARWHDEIPDVVVRSHRHRNAETRIQTYKGFGTSCVTAGWQLKTPFAFRIPGGRISRPQIGGTLIRFGDEDIFTRHKVWSLKRPPEVVL